MRILASPQMSDRVFVWIRLVSRASMLKLKVRDRSLCLLQWYALNAVGKYRAIVNGANNAFQRIRQRESTIHLRDFNAHIGTDIKHGKA